MAFTIEPYFLRVLEVGKAHDPGSRGLFLMWTLPWSVNGHLVPTWLFLRVERDPFLKSITFARLFNLDCHTRLSPEKVAVEALRERNPLSSMRRPAGVVLMVLAVLAVAGTAGVVPNAGAC